MRKAIIFDVDGTLWDAVERIAESWNILVSRELGIDAGITKENMTPFMGKPMSDFRALFPPMSEDEANKLLERCCKYENEYLLEHPGTLYPGIKEMLSTLSKEFELYIVSNCQEGYIEVLLESHGLNQYFTDFENYGRTKKMKPENIRILMERCDIDKAIYIGDTMGDKEAAEANDIPFIFASYGMGEIESVRFKVDSPSEIPEMIKKTRYFSL